MKLTRKIKKRKDKCKSRVKKRKVVRKTKKNRKEFRRRTKSRRKKKRGGMFQGIYRATLETKRQREERQRKDVEDKIEKRNNGNNLLKEALKPFLLENNKTWEDSLAKVEQKQSSEKGEIDQLELAIREALNMGAHDKKIKKTIKIKEMFEDYLKSDIKVKLDKLESQLNDAVKSGEDADELEEQLEEFDIQKKRANSMIERMQKEYQEMRKEEEAAKKTNYTDAEKIRTHANRAEERAYDFRNELGVEGMRASDYLLLVGNMEKRVNAIRAKETENDDYNLYNKLVANTDGDPKEDFITWHMARMNVLAKREVNATNEQYIVAMNFVKSKRNNEVLLGQASEVDTTNEKDKKGTFFDRARIKTPMENSSLIQWVGPGKEEEEVENTSIRLMKMGEKVLEYYDRDKTFNKDETEDEENIWRKIHRDRAWEAESPSEYTQTRAGR